MELLVPRGEAATGPYLQLKYCTCNTNRHGASGGSRERRKQPNGKGPSLWTCSLRLDNLLPLKPPADRLPVPQKVAGGPGGVGVGVGAVGVKVLISLVYSRVVAVEMPT